jgi:hypothetical protein
MRCAATTASGLKCKKNAIEGHEHCAVHMKKTKNETDVIMMPVDEVQDKTEVVAEPVENTPTKTVTETKIVEPVIADIQQTKKTYTEDDVTELINRLEKLETKLTVVKKEKATKVDTKAKLLFYHDVKRHEEVMAEVVRRGIPMVERKKKEGVYFAYAWQDIKRVTDAAFMNLSEEKRYWYIQMAKAMMA